MLERVNHLCTLKIILIKLKVTIVGGGAAGFFSAINVATNYPFAEIVILEKSNKILSKVRISGGGRCNVTHNCMEISKLSANYPRGNKELKSIFKQFDVQQTVEWFSQRKVDLKTESDERMFPTSNESQTIIDCFVAQCNILGIKIEINSGVQKVAQNEQGFKIDIHKTSPDDKYTDSANMLSDYIIIACGGNPNLNAYTWIENLGHSISKPIPSLFTFNDTTKHFATLMGLSVPNAEVKIMGTKFVQTGPLLITHWGLSGPCVIKLSAWAAEYLHAANYNFTVLVSWIGSSKEEQTRLQILNYKTTHPKQTVTKNVALSQLPLRLWLKLCELSEIQEDKIYGEMSVRHINKLVENLIRCQFIIKGKTTFKDEFVTCGGVDLNEIDMNTMESKLIKNIFFAGEVLNIDGITGGFNFQSAWSTGWVAARLGKI